VRSFKLRFHQRYWVKRCSVPFVLPVTKQPVRAFPAFTLATRLAVNRVTQFANTTQPLIDELRPAAVQLSPALEATAVLAPTLLTVMTDLAPLTSAATPGIPAIESFLDQAPPHEEH